MKDILSEHKAKARRKYCAEHAGSEEGFVYQTRPVVFNMRVNLRIRDTETRALICIEAEEFRVDVIM